MFGTSSAFRPGSLFGTTAGGASATTGNVLGVGSVLNHNPMKDFEVVQPPDDSIQALKFSPPSVQQNFLVSGSWDNLVRVWEVKQDGSTEPKAQQNMQGPALEVDWSDDGSKIFIASADKSVKMWDVASNQVIQLGSHEQSVKSCHWVKAPNYSVLMTGSWDKTLKICVKLLMEPPAPSGEGYRGSGWCYPMAVVGTAGRAVKIYKLENPPQEVRTLESPLKFQHRCVAIFKDKTTGGPTGFALGSIEGRVAIQYVETTNPKDNFTFKCHRSAELNNGYQDIYAVNDIAFHPVHGTLATVGSDGRFSFWDKDARTKLKTSEAVSMPITRCCFNKGGEVFAYGVSYDWSKGHEHYNPQQKNHIFLHSCFDELKPRAKK